MKVQQFVLFNVASPKVLNPMSLTWAMKRTA
ncbi:uncharacterized protein METZ01_LOCUS317725 [marine metagenome]|uniref:Uncharacterized protein n=1 Tax=marine metagenome TaxID=408172 RepID=A0A382NZ59_9ZZZZ